jgi:hypothetical protein
VVSVEIEKEIVGEGVPLNVENRVHELFKRVDRQAAADLGMRTVEVLQIPNLIFSILSDLFESLYVFSLDEQLVVSPKFNKGVEISYRTALQFIVRVVYYLNGDHRLLNLLNHLRVEAGLLLGENSAQILVIHDFIVKTEFYKS